MGVAGFTTFLRRNYPQAFRQLSEQEVEAQPIDHL